MRKGLPSVIVSDNGKEFDNQLKADITDLLGIQHRLITPHHLQVNAWNYFLVRFLVGCPYCEIRVLIIKPVAAIACNMQ